jgi:PAS domain S-box-containing protein
LHEQKSVRSLELAFRTKSGVVLETLASMEIIELGGERCILALTQDITKYKRAEVALAEQHSFRAAIIERAAEGLCVCHAIDEFPYVAFTVWNGRMTEITGYTMEEINARGWYQSMYPDPDVQAQAIERMSRMREGEDLLAEEWEITRADGVQRVVTISTSVLATADGAAHVLALIYDMTERKRAEEALRASQALLQGIVDHSPATIVVQDVAKGRYLLVNNQLARIFGVTQAEMIGKTRADLFPPNLVAEWSAQDRHIAATGEPMQVEDVVRHPDGTLHTSLGTKFPLYDAQGAIFAIGGIFTDISERKRMEEELAHERDLLHVLMDNIPDTIYFKDTASRFTRINQAQGRVLNLKDPNEAIGKTDLDFQAPELAAHFLQEEQAIFESGQPLIDRIEFNPMPDGQPRWFSATKAPIVGRDGGVTGLVGISRDVTERMVAEGERERLIAELKDALTNIKTLRGLLPICSSCKKIRDDRGYWNQIETYIKTYSEADFTHGICPDCVKRLYGDLYDE